MIIIIIIINYQFLQKETDTHVKQIYMQCDIIIMTNDSIRI